MQASANASVFLTPVQGATGAGAFQRSSPTGGAAKGIPLKTESPSATTPSTSPPVTLAVLICENASCAHAPTRKRVIQIFFIPTSL